MESITHLEIRGYRQEAVPNTFWREQAGADALAVVYPGYGYSAEMPVLYYPGRLFLDLGMDLLRVEYGYNRREGFQELPGDERSRWVSADAIAALQAAFSVRQYSRVCMVGKSIGTLAVASVLAGEPLAAGATCVWLTPLLDNPTVVQQIKETRGPSLVVIGTADPFYKPERISGLEQTGICQVMVVEGADHSLEIKGDLQASIRVMGKIVQRIGDFLHNASSG